MNIRELHPIYFPLLYTHECGVESGVAVGAERERDAYVWAECNGGPDAHKSPPHGRSYGQAKQCYGPLNSVKIHLDMRVRWAIRAKKLDFPSVWPVQVFKRSFATAYI